jgi:cytochrome c-type biogenesis protein CcmH
LAKDLREITEKMIKQGDSDAEIKKFMRSRYGDFVLYEPPFNWSTAFLWLGPFALLLLVIIGLVLNIRRRQQEELFHPNRATNDAEQVKVRNLMRDTPSLTSKDSEKPTP